MIYFDKNKNLLEEDKYQYELQDVKQPEPVSYTHLDVYKRQNRDGV